MHRVKNSFYGASEVFVARGGVARPLMNCRIRMIGARLVMWDPLTIKLAKFYALNAHGADGIAQAEEKFPQIAAAFMLDGDGEKTDVMKLMILADSPADAIAKKVGVDPAVVDVWETTVLRRPWHARCH